jgi:hypothetical protein
MALGSCTGEILPVRFGLSGPGDAALAEYSDIAAPDSANEPYRNAALRLNAGMSGCAIYGLCT